MVEDPNKKDKKPDGKMNKLENLNEWLYSRNASKLLHRKMSHPLSKVSYGVSTAWKKAEEIKKAKKFSVTSAFKIFFLIALLVFIASGSFAVYKFYGGTNTFSPENIDILITGDAFVSSGSDLNINVAVLNRNLAPLESATLSISYQKGETNDLSTSTAPSMDRQKIDLGTVGINETKTNNFKIMLFGKQGSRKIIKTTLEYRAKGSSASFVKEINYDVVLTNSPLVVTIDSAKEINPNQDTSFNVKVSSNSDKIAKNLILVLDYPIGFVFKSSMPDAFSGDRVFFLGDLAPGADRVISIRGSLSGSTNEQKVFRVSVGEQDNENQNAINTLYDNMSYAVSLTEPSLSAILLIGGKDTESYALQNIGKTKVMIVWSNNLPSRLEDMIITTKITGNALNKSSIRVSSGFYDSNTDTIIWNKDSESDFTAVEPGQTGTIEFEVGSIPIHSPPFVTNPQINMDVAISGTTRGSNGMAQVVSNTDRSKSIKFVSNLTLNGETLYHSGPLTNSGPIPPRIGEKTTYTILWTITNSVSDVKGAEVRAKLPAFAVKWIGSTSPLTEDISYNETTREIVWKVGDIKKGTGISSGEKKAAFQLELSPSLQQIGSAPQLIGEATLIGNDTFTGATLRNQKGSLSTRFPTDTKFNMGDEQVIQ